ncbi:hypothetical protein HA402_006957 [Bradysia odoriphaga]|nr:hypothetical protein HA402_006957 [Bradysia odoriphaga]
MYKTIRHGENSLQYTILPQHDDYKGADGKQRPAKTGRKKKSLVACIGMFFVCSIIVGAILVPLMISVEFMSSPSAWFYKAHNKTSTSGSNVKPLKLNKTEKFKVEIDSNEILSFNQQNKQQVYSTKHSTTVTYLPKSTRLDSSTIVQNGANGLPQSIKTTPSTTTTTAKSTVASTSTVAAVTPTTSTTTEQPLLPTTSTVQPAIVLTTTSTSTPTALKSPLPSASLIETLTKPFAKPIISIQPEFNDKTPTNTVDNVEKHKTPRNWIKSHWPVVDPSTYFSWSAYESGDNILFPAILCSAFVTVVVVILLCFVVGKRNCLPCSKKRQDFMAVEAENGDSAVLLTNDCPSEDE